jgi:hypothetical protein
MGGRHGRVPSRGTTRPSMFIFLQHVKGIRIYGI